MSERELLIDVQWEQPGGALGPELRATWARLQMQVDGQVITRVEDRVARSVRDAVYVPVYPLAEWVATNWWALVHEIGSVARKAGGGYHRRHSLTAASEGFALPSLVIEPVGEQILLTWERADLRECRVRFLESGSQYVHREKVEEELRGFLETVVARLEDQGVSGTLLTEEWQAIVEADSEEKEFSLVAGKLGGDPYSLSEDETKAILEASNYLSIAVADELLATATPSSVLEQASALHSVIELTASADVQLKPLQRLRGLDVDSRLSPWQQGYAAAREARNLLKLNGQVVSSIQELGEMLHVDPHEWDRAARYQDLSIREVDAVMAVSKKGGPVFAVRRGNESTRSFFICRALFEYLASPMTNAAVVAPTASERQKRNRAFAAEFLVPADRLRERLPAQIVSDDDIQEIAADFGVSTFVVEHQIENHGLAKIERLNYDASRLAL